MSNIVTPIQELIVTQDGSHSIVCKLHTDHQSNEESYHSCYGAIQESLHIYIENGLIPLLNSRLSSLVVTEMGFGTGLNALLTAIFASHSAFPIHFHTIEAFPIHQTLYEKLNYPALPLLKKMAPQLDLTSLFLSLHELPFNQTHHLTPYFSFTKYLGYFQNFKPSFLSELIYYDAFSPKFQPELWNEDAVRQISNLLKKPGRLVSYCAQGQFRRHLKTMGFLLPFTKGPFKKREITVGLIQ